MKEIIEKSLLEAQLALTNLLDEPHVIACIEGAARLIVDAIRDDKKVLSVGNGGSMCDAMHFAEELVGRYRDDRPALPAIACSDPSFITCAANDFGYDQVFARFVEGLGQPGDVLLAISTSGKSASVINAAIAARDNGVKVISLTGHYNSPLAGYADVDILCEAGDTADRVQELHIKVIHILIELIEHEMKFA